MNEEIENTCFQLFKAIKADKPNEAAALACELLAGFLSDVRRIADALSKDKPE